jgi:hypothetical protein
LAPGTTALRPLKISTRWIPKFSPNGLIRAGLGVALVVFFLVDAAGWIEFRPLSHLELQAYDARVRLFLPKARDPRVVIVDIDETSLGVEGHWPCGRDKLALLTRQLFEKYRIRAMGFDVAFSEADPSSGLPVLDSIAGGELKNDAQFHAFLQRARPSLDYDRLFAGEVGKWPVVLGFLLGGNDQKSGVLPQEADGFLARCRQTYGLPIAGLMCLPPVDEPPAPHFALTAMIARRNGLRLLSMGMSADFALAIAFGATHVRVGTAIFGERG